MRFFKHGDVLAISLPESLRKKLDINENDEYDFHEIQPGVITLLKKGQNFNSQSISSSETKSRQSTPRPQGMLPVGASAPAAQRAVPPSAGAQPSTGTALDRQGFLVLQSEDEAKAFSHRFEPLIKTGDIKGIRGFDKKFYLAARQYSDAYADKLLLALKEPKTASDLAAAVKQPQDGVLTLLYLLKEEGEIIEKKRGLFARVL